MRRFLTLLFFVLISCLTQTTQARKLALLVGVDEYDSVPSLKCCVNDIKALKEALVKVGFKESDIQILITGGTVREMPTKEKIEQKVAEILSAAKPDDLVFFAFSGHGAREDKTDYFCPPFANPDNLEGTCVSITKVMDDLAKCQAQFKWMVVDACRNDPNNARDAKAFQVIPAPPAGIALFQSCDKGEKSYEENRSGGHGYFTKNFVAALSGEADANRDGKLTLLEVCSWTTAQTQAEVEKTENKTQRPYLNLSAADFTLSEDMNVPKAQELAAEARKAMESENYALAISKFDEAIALCPRLESLKRERDLARKLMERPQNPSSSLQAGASEVIKVNGVDFAFRYCPPGTFMMGSPESEEGRRENEKQHQVTLTKGFWILETEITQKQWTAIMEDNPSHFKGDSLPVENVTLEDCQAFCKKCSQLNFPVRLPTEAQWEYACRAGSATAYFWGKSLNGDKANCNGTQPCGTEVKGNNLAKTAPVGSYKSNNWGLYDMHGNVWEWCADGYESYSSANVTDPFGGKYRDSFCFRGGSWASAACDCRSALRNQRSKSYQNFALGFRIVISKQGMEDYKNKDKGPKPVTDNKPPKVRDNVLVEPPLTWSVNSIHVAWTTDSDVPRKVGFLYGINPANNNSLKIIPSDKITESSASYKMHPNPLSSYEIIGSKISASYYVDGEFSYNSNKNYSSSQWSDVEKTFVNQVLSLAFDQNNSDQRLVFTVDFVNHTGSRLLFNSNSDNTISVYCGSSFIGKARLISEDKSIASTGKPVSFQFELPLNERGRQLLAKSRPKIRMEDGQLKIQSLSSAPKRIEDAVLDSSSVTNYFTVAICSGNEVKEWKIRWFRDNPVSLYEALEAINDNVCELNNNNEPVFEIKDGRIVSVCGVSFTANSNSAWVSELDVFNGTNLQKVNYDSCLSITPGRGERYIFQLVSQEIKRLQAKGRNQDGEAAFELSKRYDNGDGTPEDKVWALKTLQKAAEFGNAEAQCYLGLCYDFGRGVQQDEAEAVKWYRKAAEQGYAWARYNLGACYEFGNGIPKNWGEAVKWYSIAAEQGYASAQCKLGVCYEKGNGVRRDFTLAVKWYRKAAEQGYAIAQRNLAFCYYNGEGVTQDYTEAVKWFRQAAEQGDVIAQCSLGMCYANGEGVRQDFSDSVNWYRKAAEQGFPPAQIFLGAYYAEGKGVRQDYAEAVKWYYKAAEQGDADAQFILGECYADGKGVTQDYSEAVKWYRKAADQGMPDAQFYLGLCYADGKGVTQDFSEAVKWFRQAAEQGNVDAQVILGTCYADGNGVRQDYTEAVKWFRQAAEQGDADAQFVLGACYADGKGVTQDYSEAVIWYRKAADQGMPDAQFILGVIYQEGIGVSKNITEAEKWYRLAADQGDERAKKALKKLFISIH